LSAPSPTPGKFPYYWLGKSGTPDTLEKNRKAGVTRSLRFEEGKITRAGTGDVWTREELSELREMYRERSQKDILDRFPNRSWKSVTTAGRNLRVRRRTHGQVEAKFTDVELGFLAGLVEGEGTVGITKCGTRLYPYVYILANTDMTLIDHTHTIVERAGFLASKLLVHSQSEKAKGRRPVATISMHGFQPSLAILRALTPYLVGKRRRAELVMEFCETRIGLWETGAHGQRTPYTEREWEIAREVRTLNRKGRPI
jgi:hypothetical protein